MSDWAEPEEAERPPRTSGLAWVALFVLVAMLVADFLAMCALGSNANQTFQTGPQPAGKS